MNHFHVTILCPEHLSQAAELESLCFSDPWSEDALKILTQAGGVGAIALTDNGRAVGYGGMLTVLDEGQITNIAVHPDFRRQGLAREVTGALIEYSKSNGICSVSLEVRESNCAAIALYEGLGFLAVGKRPRFYSDPAEDALLMEVRI